jgi:hypothetical protein
VLRIDPPSIGTEREERIDNRPHLRDCRLIAHESAQRLHVTGNRAALVLEPKQVEQDAPLTEPEPFSGALAQQVA